MPIKSVRHKGLWLLYEEDDARGVPEACADKLRDMLGALATAQAAEDMAVVPGWELRRLKDEFVDYWTLTLARNCWLIFRFQGGHASELDLVDDLSKESRSCL